MILILKLLVWCFMVSIIYSVLVLWLKYIEKPYNFNTTIAIVVTVFLIFFLVLVGFIFYQYVEAQLARLIETHDLQLDTCYASMYNLPKMYIEIIDTEQIELFCEQNGKIDSQILNWDNLKVISFLKDYRGL